MSNNSALCSKRATLSARCYSLSYRTCFQQHEAAGACTARGHEGTERESALLGFRRHRLHPCHTGWLRIWANAIQQARAEPSRGSCLLPQWNCSPCDARLSGKAQLCPCSVHVSSQSPVTLSPGLVKVQPRAGSRARKRPVLHHLLTHHAWGGEGNEANASHARI